MPSVKQFKRMKHCYPYKRKKGPWKPLVIILIAMLGYTSSLAQTTVIGFCHDNGTPSDTTDDVIEFTYDPTTDAGCGLTTGFYGGVVRGNDSTTIDTNYDAVYLFPTETPFDLTSSAPGGDVTYRIRRAVGTLGSVGSGDKWIYLTNGAIECWLEIIDPINPCPPPCTIAALAGLPSLCNPADSSFSISGDFVYSNAPSDSVLVRYGSRTDTLVLTGSPMSYMIDNLESDGILKDLIVSYIADNSCSDTIQIQAPDPCTTPVDINLTVERSTGCGVAIDDVITFTIRAFRTDATSGEVDLIIKDSLEAGFEFISYVASEGTFNDLTGLWSGVSISQIDTATLDINVRVLTNRGGFVCNNAWVLTQSRNDVDSSPGNNDMSEDDADMSCISVPATICSARSETIVLDAPTGLASYQWQRNGVDIPSATGDTFLAIQDGIYTVVLSDPSACNSFDCCPIVITAFCDCNTAVCMPFSIVKN